MKTNFENFKKLNFIFAFLLLLVIFSCQNTTEPIDVTKSQKIEIKVVDQYNNFILGARVSYLIKKNGIIIEKKELPGSTTGFFEGNYNSPIMTDSIEIIIIVEPPLPPLSNDYIGQSPDTLTFNHCTFIQTVFTFNKQRTINISCNCGDNIQLRINNIDSISTVTTYGILSKNTFGAGIRIYAFSSLPKDVMVNILSGTSFNNLIDRGLLSTSGILIGNDDFYQLKYTFTPNPRTPVSSSSSSFDYFIKYPEPQLNENCTCSVNIITEAIRIEKCECPTYINKQIIYDQINPASVCLNSPGVDYMISLSEINNINEDCDILIEPVRNAENNFRDNRLSIISVNGNSSFNIPYILRPGDNLKNMIVRVIPLSQGLFSPIAEYIVRKRDSKGTITDCGRFSIQFKGIISQGECSILGFNTPSTPQNLFPTSNPIPSGFPVLTQCLDNIDASRDRILYVRNDNQYCFLPVSINITGSKLFQILGYNLPFNDTIPPNTTIGYRIRFSVTNKDVWPSGNYADNPIIEFYATLSVRTGGVDINPNMCNQDYNLVGQVDFNCNNPLDIKLGEWGQPNKSGQDYTQGYDVMLQNNQNYLGANNANKSKLDLYIESIDVPNGTSRIESGTTAVSFKFLKNGNLPKTQNLCRLNDYRNDCNSTGSWNNFIDVRNDDFVLIRFTLIGGSSTYYGLIYVKSIANMRVNSTENTPGINFEICYPYTGF